MSRVTLGDVAIERRESCKGDKSRYPVVGLEHLTPEEINLTAWDESGENTFTKIFHKGDILFGRRRAYLKKAALAPFDGICSGDITVIEAKSDYILPELLPFVIQNDNFFDFAVGKSAGSLSPRVKWEHLKEYEFNLPSIEEQKNISKILWSINDTIEAYKKLTALTDELVKAKFVEMFGDVEKIQLEQIAIITMGQSPSSETYNSNNQGIPFYQGSGEFTDKYVGKGMFCTVPTRIAKSGDVLMSVRAPVGTVNLTLRDCCIGRGLAAIRSKLSAEYNEFFLYAFRAMINEFASMGHGTTILAINKNELHSLMIPNASPVEQKKFIFFAQQVDKSKSEIRQSMTTAKAMMKKIITENLG